MTLVNSLSVLVYIFCILLGRCGRWNLAAMLITLEVAAYCPVTVYLVGWDAGAQGYLPVIMFPILILFYVPKFEKIVQVSVMCASMAACCLIRLYIPPVVRMSALSVVETINLIICMSAALLTVAISTFSNRITEGFYQNRIENLTGAANRDELTGLWNRRYATRALEELFADPLQRDRAFIAMLDIDFFKTINDTHGHDVGDVVLRQLSEIIHSSLRSTDLVARWGGEEFLIVLGGTNHVGANKALNTLREKVQDFVFLSETHQLRLTVTAGFCGCEGDSPDYTEYLRRSDEALYLGKNSGRNKVVDYDAASAQNPT